jgi:hypothetical protein
MPEESASRPRFWRRRITKCPIAAGLFQSWRRIDQASTTSPSSAASSTTARNTLVSTS